jgi:hypothetical protein
MLYGLTAVLCLVRRDYSHALISGLALVVMVGLGLAAWLKSASRSIPEWLRAGSVLCGVSLIVVAHGALTEPAQLVHRRHRVSAKSKLETLEQQVADLTATVLALNTQSLFTIFGPDLPWSSR